MLRVVKTGMFTSVGFFAVTLIIFNNRSTDHTEVDVAIDETFGGETVISLLLVLTSSTYSSSDVKVLSEWQ